MIKHTQSKENVRGNGIVVFLSKYYVLKVERISIPVSGLAVKSKCRMINPRMNIGILAWIITGLKKKKDKLISSF